MRYGDTNRCDACVVRTRRSFQKASQVVAFGCSPSISENVYAISQRSTIHLSDDGETYGSEGKAVIFDSARPELFTGGGGSKGNAATRAVNRVIPLGE